MPYETKFSSRENSLLIFRIPKVHTTYSFALSPLFIVKMASHGSKEVVRGIEVFSEPDYYPTPSDTVISYSIQGSKKQIIKTNIIALIVKLTSPLDVIDYSFLSDFFLSYRKFLAPRELLSLFIDRFRWSAEEVLNENCDRRKLGEISLVRTFVLIRHWILNYFAQDFLANDLLRRQFVEFVNSSLNRGTESPPKMLLNVIVNIKKSWVYCVKLMWEDVEFSHHLETAQDWLQFRLQDVTTRSKVNKEGKRLSLYALQSSKDPAFRNNSVLSLYLSEENFQLPESNTILNSEKSSKITKRTASMFLFPQDNLNALVLKASKKSNEEEENKGSISSRSLPIVSQGNNVSELMKDLTYSVSPSVDKVIPPTPAKKVEFILRSSYLPPDLSSRSSRTHLAGSAPHCKSKHSQIHQHRGILGLLTKWKKNHHTQTSAKPIGARTNPEIDNLIKFVFSITSLENRANNSQDLENVIGSKFDILSARTIDEVEHLIAMENELLLKLKNQDTNLEVRARRRNSNNEPKEEFNAMDNLNLYKTISSIATSVISLSQTLKQHQLASPSNKVQDRRLVKSSIAALRTNGSSNAQNNLSVTEIKTPEPKTGGTNKLVFHSSASVNKGANHNAHDSRDLCTPTKSNYLVSSNGNVSNTDMPHKEPLFKINQLSISTSPRADGKHPSILTEHDIRILENERTEQNTTPLLKRKGARQNLREFNFEEQYVQPKKSTEEFEEDEQTDNDNSSFFTSYEEVSVKSSPKQSTPASSFLGQTSAINSGRISVRRSTVVSTKNPTTESLTHYVGEESDYARREEELKTSEKEICQLEEHMSVVISDLKRKSQRKNSRSSDNPSIATNLLFASRQGSPKKQEHDGHNSIDHSVKDQEASKKILIGLSTTPSIHSIVSEESFSSFHSNDTFERHSPKEKIDTTTKNKEPTTENKSQYTGDSLLDAEGTEGETNKYLFSPDSESIDYASPEKNVEDLKNQFFGIDAQSDNTNDDDIVRDDCNTPMGHDHHRRTVSPIVSPNKINESKLNIFANMTDESLQDDPVNVALMKLEGTYDFKSSDSGNDENVQQGTPTSSELAKEVERLGLKDINISNTIINERHSLFIERRRQVKSEMPYTPGRQPRANEKLHQIPDEEISKLVMNYRLQDQRLHVANADQHVPFILMYDSMSIAKQMTLIEREIIKEIDWKDLLDLKMKDKVPSVTSWLQLLVQNQNLSGIDLAISRFNLTVDWIVSEIVLVCDTKLRRNTIQRFIHIAEHCKNFQNYNTLMQIVLALNSIVVQSFKEAWRLIEPGDLLTWEQLKEMPSLEKNYHNIRKMLNEIDPIKGCIPFIVVYLSDLSLNAEKRDWLAGRTFINYNKFQTNVDIVKNFIQRAQWSKFYEIPVDEELLSKCVYISSLTPEELRQLTTS